MQWNLSIATTKWDTSLPSGAHLGGQGPPRWAPGGRNCYQELYDIWLYIIYTISIITYIKSYDSCYIKSYQASYSINLLAITYNEPRVKRVLFLRYSAKLVFAWWISATVYKCFKDIIIIYGLTKSDKLASIQAKTKHHKVRILGTIRMDKRTYLLYFWICEPIRRRLLDDNPASISPLIRTLWRRRMGGLIADYRASGAWSRDLHVDRCAWTDTMKPRFVSRGRRRFHSLLAHPWQQAKLSIGWTRKCRLWKAVRIPIGVMNPESTGHIGTPRSLFRLTNHTGDATSQLPTLPHTPPTAVELPVWACVPVYVDCVHDDDGTSLTQ